MFIADCLGAHLVALCIACTAENLCQKTWRIARQGCAQGAVSVPSSFPPSVDATEVAQQLALSSEHHHSPDDEVTLGSLSTMQSPSRTRVAEVGVQGSTLGMPFTLTTRTAAASVTQPIQSPTPAAARPSPAKTKAQRAIPVAGPGGAATMDRAEILANDPLTMGKRY